MKRWPITLVLMGVLALPAGAASAQESDSGQVYLNEDYDEHGRWSIGLALGLVELGDNVIEGQRLVSDDDVEPYFKVNLRIPFGYRRANYGSAQGGFQGYLEPEIGYWDGDQGSDTLVGLNIVGGMPFNAVEFFIGGGLGAHFVEREFELQGFTDDSDTALGVNAHFGVDLSVTENVAFFGVGRFDLVDDDRDELEGKAFVGLRFRI